MSGVGGRSESVRSGRESRGKEAGKSQLRPSLRLSLGGYEDYLTGAVGSTVEAGSIERRVR